MNLRTNRGGVAAAKVTEIEIKIAGDGTNRAIATGKKRLAEGEGMNLKGIEKN